MILPFGFRGIFQATAEQKPCTSNGGDGPIIEKRVNPNLKVTVLIMLTSFHSFSYKFTASQSVMSIVLITHSIIDSDSKLVACVRL